MSPHDEAAQRILDGHATIDDIRLWMSWTHRASLGPMGEKIVARLLDLHDELADEMLVRDMRFGDD